MFPWRQKRDWQKSLKENDTSRNIENMLVRYGPLWCAGFWFGHGHIIVLTGIKGEEVYFNDPDGGVQKKGSVAWFNAKLAGELDGCLMYKDSHAY
ncbi:MAG: papain-like cysteine protease family protein [Bacteroidota bacterium]